ncbi:PREDICTED: uncharacterized protein LOC101310008 [Fragaria vesca subsp. vesca]|uniref:uncharacterized protein LOC101310008 n=1 Tax=Fragaria vesca subsp. vesca TaxID=101020 RepID=UPI0002C36B28|nr:PREDICTED: uncharacterized protein LOC101310008 [Fragaria vesca subsp. vesca]
MAVVRALIMSSKLVPRVPIVKTMQWRITSVRCAGIGTGSGPQMNLIPEGDTITDKVDDQKQKGSNTSNDMYISEDEIAEAEEPIPAQVDDYGSTDESPIAKTKE